MRIFIVSLLLIATTSACTPAPTSSPPAQPISTGTHTLPPPPTPSFTPFPPTHSPTPLSPSPLPTLPPLPTAAPTSTAAPPPTDTPTPSPIPAVESLKAQVTADLLSCRYGPGPEYLYLYALRKTANITLIGRTDGDNWHWVYVQGKNKCWLNASYIEIQGNWQDLPIVYPGIAKLPVSPYYQSTAVLSAVRNGNEVSVSWLDIPLRPGDEEDESMLHYIIEAWHCVGGQLIFEPLATNDVTITIVDEPGCSQPSHGRIFVQEKHGFAGPAEIPWPP